MASWRDARLGRGYGLLDFRGHAISAWQNRELIGGIFVEPYDWYLTAKEIYREPGNKWNYAGFAPLVPGRIARHGDDVGESFDDIYRFLRDRGNRLGQQQGREFRVDQLELCEFDEDLASHVRGWLKNEQRRIAQGKATRPRMPPGYEMSHGRTTPAREGYDYSNLQLQGTDLNRLEEIIRRRQRRP